MRLTKDVVICLDLMELLKNKTYPARVTDLADKLETTPAFLKQIVHKLIKAKILSVRRGPGGGVLRTNPEPISVLEIFKALDRPLVSTENSKENEILNKVAEVLKTQTC